MAKQRVTLYIDSAVWLKFRQMCLLDGTSASAKAEDLMRREVADVELPGREPRTRRADDRSKDGS